MFASRYCVVVVSRGVLCRSRWLAGWLDGWLAAGGDIHDIFLGDGRPHLQERSDLSAKEDPPLSGRVRTAGPLRSGRICALAALSHHP